MQNSVFQFAIFLTLCHAVSSCGYRQPEGARLNRRAVAGIAIQRAVSDGMEVRRFKRQRPIYLPGSRTWYACFEERGMLLAVGERFTVFVHDPTGTASLHRNAGTRGRASRARLDERLSRLATGSWSRANTD